MNFIYCLILFILFYILASYHVVAQSTLTDDPAKPLITAKMLDRMDDKTAFVNENLEKQTTRYLSRMSHQERRLKKKLMKLDSLTAQKLFNGVEQKYAALEGKMNNISSLDPGSLKGEYLPYVDSIKGALKFLDKNKDLLATGSGISDKLNNVNQLQNSIHKATEVTAFLKERKQQIGEALKKYTKLPKGLSKGYGHSNKQAYYYSAQVKEYKELLKDPSKIEQKALELLNKVPAFASFMQKNSFLSGLFSIPPNYGTPEALAGLQIRAQVQQLISNRVGGGTSAQAMIQQNLGQAQSQLNQLKDKINKLGANSDVALPDFKPNAQKTKSFKDRIELGSNLQTAKSDWFFPITTDVGASAGYKLNGKSVIGLGASYKFGMGRGIRDIAFTSEGVGLRSFMDYKLRGSLWLTGGAEMNYRARFDNFEVLKDFSGWQQSALIGISKKYPLSKKMKGNAQFLYNVLWRQNVPSTQPVIFRLGYTLK